MRGVKTNTKGTHITDSAPTNEVRGVDVPKGLLVNPPDTVNGRSQGHNGLHSSRLVVVVERIPHALGIPLLEMVQPSIQEENNPVLQHFSPGRVVDGGGH